MSYGIALCEHNVPVRVNDDGTMLTTCRECTERIKAVGLAPPSDVSQPPGGAE